MVIHVPLFFMYGACRDHSKGKLAQISNIGSESDYSRQKLMQLSYIASSHKATSNKKAGISRR
ncbi:hypothetical protein J2T15_000196 [Paenibacillus harenae]|uniref:Uncharacterized protein n=1 Tax=Paenibacillus harenae TaxID=306543 RepID=A0ABT9TTV4_PAEHA|nr:hypothetical protein [Paenibacillus harenae]